MQRSTCNYLCMRMYLSSYILGIQITELHFLSQRSPAMKVLAGKWIVRVVLKDQFKQSSAQKSTCGFYVYANIFVR